MILLKLISSITKNRKFILTVVTVFFPLAPPALVYAEEGKEPAACELVCKEVETALAECVFVPKGCNNKDNSKVPGKKPNIINPGLLNPGLIIPKDQFKPKNPEIILPGDAFKPKSPGTLLPGDAFKPKSSGSVIPDATPKSKMTSISYNTPKSIITSISDDTPKGKMTLGDQRKPKNLGIRVVSKSQSKRQSIVHIISKDQDK